jgi:ribonuclease BN (tRNA processing enzyme)
MLETLTILGGGGWFPAHGRHTASALLRGGDSAIVIDAGTGIARLAERPELLEGVNRLDILLTHFHLDHIAGVAYLSAAGTRDQTTVWGPGKLLYGSSTKALLAQLSHEPFHPVPLDEQDIEVRDIPGQEIELSGVRIHTRRQNRHSAPTLGYRFGDSFTWITDTAYEEDTARFAAGCRMLAHESWYTTAAPRNPDIHSSALQAAQVAADAGVSNLLMIHQPPFQPELGELLLEARTAFAQSVLAEDGADMSALLRRR